MIKVLPIEQVHADPNQPRQEFDKKQMELLKNSIKAKGILSPIAVEKQTTGNYLVIDGERRYRTALALGLLTVPTIVYETMDDLERISTRFHLQEQHSNWTPFDKARAIVIMKDTTGLTSIEMAELLGLNLRMINGYLSILNLSKRSVNFINDKKLTFAMIRLISALKNSIEDVNKKEKIEDAIITKLDKSVITLSKEIQTYINSIKLLKDEPKKQVKIIDKIINDEYYTPKMAADECGYGDYVNQRRILHWCTTLRTFIRKENEFNRQKYFSPADGQSMQKTIDVLTQYLESSIIE